MAAARHASRGDEKRGDQAALSPLLLIVETRKRGDLEPGLAHGGARAAPRVSFAEALLRGACGAWHHDAAMGELELTRTSGDRRLYVLADVGTVRLKGWASRAARAEANGRTWEIARRGALAPGRGGNRRGRKGGRAVQGAYDAAPRLALGNRYGARQGASGCTHRLWLLDATGGPEPD